MASLGSYSISLSATTLSGDIIFNYFLVVTADIPVAPFVYVLLDTIGRTKMLALANFILGGSAIVIAALPGDAANWILFFYVFGKLN